MLRRDYAIQGARYASTLPRFRLREDSTADNCCSIWVFVLLGVEAMKAYRANPYFVYVASILCPQAAHTFLLTETRPQHRHHPHSHLDHPPCPPPLRLCSNSYAALASATSTGSGILKSSPRPKKSSAGSKENLTSWADYRITCPLIRRRLGDTVSCLPHPHRRRAWPA